MDNYSAEIVCLRCGEHRIVPNRSKLYYGRCCLSCSKLHSTKNMIKDVHPEILDYLVNKNDRWLASQSSKRIEIFCPECNNIFTRQVMNIFNRSAVCPKCSCGRSFPNRIGSAILNYFNMDYIPEKTFDWAISENGNSLKYDFFLTKFNCILELDGGQHKKFIPKFHKNKFEYEKQVRRDLLKENLALENGIEAFIRVDCADISFEEIANRIFENITKFLDNKSFTKSDYLLIFKQCFNPIDFDGVIECFEKYHIKPKQISDLYNVPYEKVYDILKTANALGICNYNKDYFSAETIEHMANENKIKILQFSLNGELLNKYDSVNDAACTTGTSRTPISMCLNGTYKMAGGFIWIREDEYTEEILQRHVESNKKKYLFNSRKILQISPSGDPLREFDSVIVAIKETGVAHIRDVLYGKRKMAGGYIWKYK